MIKLPAYLTSFGSRTDGSASIRFASQELSDEEFLIIKRLHNQFGWLIFSENPIQPADIPSEQAEDKNKTPSKRLRNVLFKLSQQEGIPKEKFEEYYRMKMERFIDSIKARLD